MFDNARDINGIPLEIGDRVRCTHARVLKYNGLMREGEELIIDDIYPYPLNPGELVGSLYYVDGSGSVWNSELGLYELVEKGKP